MRVEKVADEGAGNGERATRDSQRASCEATRCSAAGGEQGTSVCPPSGVCGYGHIRTKIFNILQDVNPRTYPRTRSTLPELMHFSRAPPGSSLPLCKLYSPLPPLNLRLDSSLVSRVFQSTSVHSQIEINNAFRSVSTWEDGRIAWRRLGRSNPKHELASFATSLLQPPSLTTWTRILVATSLLIHLRARDWGAVC